MKTQYFLSFFLFLVSIHTAHSQVTKLEPIKVGKYINSNVENVNRRVTFFLNSEEKLKLGLNSKQLAMYNFKHRRNGSSEFFILTIPSVTTAPNGYPLSVNYPIIKKINFNIKRWAELSRPATKSIEVHSVLDFELASKKEAKIYRVVNGSAVAETNNSDLTNLVLTIEAIRSEKNIDAGFFPEALGPNFVIGYRLISKEELNKQYLDDTERKVSSWPLNFSNAAVKNISLTQAPMDAVFIQALIENEKVQRMQMYNFLTNNCTNNLFRIFDLALKYKSVDPEKVVESLDLFVKNDLPNLQKFVTTVAQKEIEDKSTTLELPAPVAETMINSLNSISINWSTQFGPKLNDLKMSIRANFNKGDYSSLTGLPPFILGHLKARKFVQ
jgi:hypothetical protein